jgi:hypothetical protein
MANRAFGAVQVSNLLLCKEIASLPAVARNNGEGYHGKQSSQLGITFHGSY